MHDLDRLFHTSGRFVGSAREPHSQLEDSPPWCCEMGCLGTASWLSCSSSCVSSGYRRNAHTTPASSLEPYTRVYQKCEALSWYSIMILVLSTQSWLSGLLCQPTPGPALFQNGIAERQAVFLCSVFFPSKASSTAEQCVWNQCGLMHSDPGVGIGKGYEIRIPSLTV